MYTVCRRTSFTSLRQHSSLLSLLLLQNAAQAIYDIGGFGDLSGLRNERMSYEPPEGKKLTAFRWPSFKRVKDQATVAMQALFARVFNVL